MALKELIAGMNQWLMPLMMTISDIIIINVTNEKVCNMIEIACEHSITVYKTYN